jgi:hypothetical protein
VNVLFKEPSHSAELLFIKHRSKLSYRLGANLVVDNGAGENNYALLSLGAQRYFKQSKKFHFYFGSDALYELNFQKGKNELNHTAGILPFLGIQLNIGKHFSLSTEPGFYAGINMQQAPDKFVKTEDTFELRLLNIGHIRAFFSF